MPLLKNMRPIDVINVLLTLGVFGLLIVFIFIRTQAQEKVQQTVAVQNAPPVVETVTQSMTLGGPAADLFFLTTGKATPLFVWGRVSDPNGCDDVTSVSLKVYRTDLGPNCKTEDGLCMTTPDVRVEGCVIGFNFASYAATIDLPYFTDPTDIGSPSEGKHWSVLVTATDRAGAHGTKRSSDFDVASICAMEAGDKLDFGVLTPGATSAPTPLNLSNVGNRAFDFDVQSYGDLACGSVTLQHLSAQDLHVSLNADTTFEQSTALEDPLVLPSDNLNGVTANSLQISPNYAFDYTPNNIPRPIYLETNVQTKLTSSGSSDVFFFLQIPQDLTQGTCYGSLGITAVPRY